MQSLREAGSLDDLDSAWEAIKVTFRGVGIPIDVEAFRNDRAASLRQAAAKQEETKL